MPPLVIEYQDITQGKSASDRRNTCLKDSSKDLKSEHKMKDTFIEETVSIDIQKKTVRFQIDKEQENGIKFP